MTLPAPVEPEVLAGAEPIRAPRSRRRDRPPPWMWPAAVVILIPIVAPLAVLVSRAFDAGRPAWDILTSARTMELLVRSIGFTFAVTAGATVIGVAAAWATERLDLPGRRAWTVITVLPLVIPSYVIALSYVSAGGRRGLFADLIGVALPAVSGFWGAWLALTVSTYPYVYLVVRASLARLDPGLEEVAHGLGAAPRRSFLTIVLPQLRPAIVAGALLAALYTLSDFGAVSLMRFDVFTRVIYAQYQGRIDRTPAIVLSGLLIVVALVVLWIEHRTRGAAAYHRSRAHRPARRTGLSARGRAGAVAGLAVLATIGLAVPVATLTAWLIRGWIRGDVIDMRWGALTGSVAAAVAAAALATVASIPIAVLTVRHRSRITAAIERTIYVFFSLPHITIALAVVFFASSFLGPLYQSFAVLVVVYAVIFLAQATGTGIAALLQVDPRLEEASRGMGRSRSRTLFDITLPLMRSGLLTGAALVFLTTMKELPATLLLRPTGFDTLSVRIWSTANDLFYARAAAPALLLVAVSAVPAYLLLTRIGTPK